MINFIENKKICWSNVEFYLNKSKELNHYANYGPAVTLLESRLHKIFNLTKENSVIMTNSGASALNALIAIKTYINNKKLKWCISSFGFACTNQGLLNNACIIDCDEKGIINLDLLPKCDGIILTNVFGTLKCIKKIQDFCKNNNLILIIDSALNFNSCEHVENELISFHHTKPWGIGEGGCFIINKQHEDLARKIINFGILKDKLMHKLSFNGKMSDISAAFILDRLDSIDNLQKEYKDQYERIKNIGLKQGFNLLGDNIGWPAYIPFLGKKSLFNISNEFVKLQKYYRPLKNTPNATNIYNKIINFPCHNELINLSDNNISACLEKIC